MDEIKELSKVIGKLKKEEIELFLKELLTNSEINTLSKRWRILKLLSEGETQRKIAQDLNVGLCKVTRGAKILKNEKAICKRFLNRR